MGITLNRVLNSFEGSSPSNGAEKALLHIASGIDDLNDLIKDSHNIQMTGISEFGDKKAKALMIVIEKIVVCVEKIETYPRQPQFWFLYREISRLFEKAKSIKKAENETDFQAAIKDL